MSEEDIKILGALYEACNHRDFDGAVQYMDRAVEIGLGVRAPDRDSALLGHDGWKEFIRVDIETWEAVTVEPLERIETEDGRILSVDLWHFRGRDGIQIERELPTLFTFRDGLIARIEGFTEKAEALEATGLAE